MGTVPVKVLHYYYLLLMEWIQMLEISCWKKPCPYVGICAIALTKDHIDGVFARRQTGIVKQLGLLIFFLFLITECLHSPPQTTKDHVLESL